MKKVEEYVGTGIFWSPQNQQGVDSPECNVMTSTGNVICRTEEHDSAEIITHSLNHHDSLVEALENVLLERPCTTFGLIKKTCIEQNIKTGDVGICSHCKASQILKDVKGE